MPSFAAIVSAHEIGLYFDVAGGLCAIEPAISKAGDHANAVFFKTLSITSEG